MNKEVDRVEDAYKLLKTVFKLTNKKIREKFGAEGVEFAKTLIEIGEECIKRIEKLIERNKSAEYPIYKEKVFLEAQAEIIKEHIAILEVAIKKENFSIVEYIAAGHIFSSSVWIKEFEANEEK